MAKISINLLPSEFLTQELKAGKFYKVQAVGVAVILGMIFLTSVTLALRILQSRNLNLVQARLTEAEQRASDLKSTQASLILLKDRLKVVNQYLGIPSKQNSIYNLVDRLIPSSVLVNTITVARDGEVVIVASVTDSKTLDNLITSLTSKDTNQDIVKQVSIENLSRARDGFYRISLKIKPN